MALEGSLLDMSLTDLIQIFKMGPKSGVLVLVHGDERGVIYVSAGRLIDAAVVRGPNRHMAAIGEEAVLYMLQWDDAAFSFRHDIALDRRPARIVHDSEWLLLEGLRRRTKPARMLPHEQITLATRFELAPLPNTSESGVHLDLDQWRLLSQVSSNASLRELCESIGMDSDHAIRIATELVVIGLIVVMPPPPSRIERPRPVVAAAPVRTRTNLVPAMAGASGGETTGRGLLSAIMRRIRGL
jgi:hypothetical protein